VLAAGSSSSNGRFHDEEPWYRRLPTSYIVLIIAAVIVVGGAIAYGASQFLGGSDSNGGGTQTSSSSSGGDSGSSGSSSKKPKKPKATVDPKTVKVAVFNGTLVSGLGAQYGDKVAAAGFPKPVVAQAPENGQKAESVVMYAPGAKAKAQLVRKKLDINNIEPVDDVFSGLAGSADVVVVVGADHTQ
jgi:hypothetical protein